MYARLIARLDADLGPKGFIRKRVSSFERELDGIKHWVRVRRVQEHLGDPIIVDVMHTLLLAELSERFMSDDLFGLQFHREEANQGLPKDDSAENAWLITGDSDPEKIADEMLAYIRQGLAWLDIQRTSAQLVELLLECGNHVGAAVVAKAHPGSGDVGAILVKGLEGLTDQRARQGFVNRVKKFLGVELSAD